MHHPKTKKNSKEICNDLDILCFKVGRVLDVRWVASNWRADNAVFIYYTTKTILGSPDLMNTSLYTSNKFNIIKIIFENCMTCV